jgi:hypothetical protein
MTRVSWLSSIPVSVVGPSANAARIMARLVMLFDPGGRMEPLIGESTGWISMEFMSVLGRTSDCSKTFVLCAATIKVMI